MSARILVIGGGYAGRIAAHRLARYHSVSVIDPSPHRVQRIALHRRAVRGTSVSAALAPPLARSGITVIQDRAVGIEAGRVHTAASGCLDADRILIALGSRTAPSPVKGLHQIGDLAGAERLHAALAAAESPTVVILGAGLTGLELAAELGYARPDANVHLMDRSRLEGRFSADAVEGIRARMQALGVQLHEGVEARATNDHRVETSDGPMDADLVVWCGGMVANALSAESGLPVDRRGRVHVDAQLQVVGHPGIYAAGDAAHMVGCDWQRMGCVLALPMGVHAATSVIRDLSGADQSPFGFHFALRCIELGGGAAMIQHTDPRDRPTAATGGLRATALKALLYRLVLDLPALEARLGLPLYSWPGQGEHAA